MGFGQNNDLIKKSHIFTSLVAANSLLDKNYTKPYYILTDSAMEDMELPHYNSIEEGANTVVVGLAEEKFDYQHMNQCFRILEKFRLEKDTTKIKNPFIAINLGRYHKTSDGNSLGPGCFAKGLEFSSDVSPIVVGKPSPKFFHSCLENISKDINPDNAIMIGDDSKDDVNGAIAAGLNGILVKTGKYQVGDEKNCPEALYVGESFDEVVDYLTNDLLV